VDKSIDTADAVVYSVARMMTTIDSSMGKEKKYQQQNRANIGRASKGKKKQEDQREKSFFILASDQLWLPTFPFFLYF
jgi:hypothetical protein